MGTDKLAEVQQSLSQRVEAFTEEEDNFPSAPAYREDEDPGDSSPTGLYPALPAQAGVCTMPRSISLHHVQPDPTDGMIKKEGGGSLGSSPQISLNSTGSSRSITPRLDSDTSI